jgi:hypothetical protein
VVVQVGVTTIQEHQAVQVVQLLIMQVQSVEMLYNQVNLWTQVHTDLVIMVDEVVLLWTNTQAVAAVVPVQLVKVQNQENKVVLVDNIQSLAQMFIMQVVAEEVGVQVVQVVLTHNNKVAEAEVVPVANEVVMVSQTEAAAEVVPVMLNLCQDKVQVEVLE